MKFTHATSATSDGWEFTKIEVNESYNEVFVNSIGLSNYIEVYQQGIDQGLITVIGPWIPGVDG